MQDNRDLNSASFSEIYQCCLNQSQYLTQPLYNFVDDSEDLIDKITIDMQTEFIPMSGQNPPLATSEAASLPNESSGYQCNSYSANNGVMRSYSNDLNQPINQQTSVSTIGNNQHLGMHHLQYQSASPSGGDGSSTHNSPFTPSPSQRFDYPTSPSVKPSIPPNTDYPGDYNFQINFGETTDSAPKSAQYTYSHTLNKLFVKMNVTCPIRFKCDRPPPMNCAIRAMPVFKRPEHVTDVVTRCPNHRIPDEAHYMQKSGHLIRADMPDNHNVWYHVAPDMRESVAVMYEQPQIGAEFTTILYKFMCLSSCVGGINRRPLLAVFLLENPEGQILGRRVVEVRICSCPGRDRSQEEKRKMNEVGSASSNGLDKNSKRSYKNIQGSMEIFQTLPGKRKRSNGDDQEDFILKVRGREKYLLLKRVKEALDLMDYVTPQQQQAYQTKEDQYQANIRQLTTDASCLLPTSSNERKGISTVLTMSNPISPDVTTASIENLLTPTHSSQPLTATPGLPTTRVDGYNATSSFSSSAGDFNQRGDYWTVDASELGCDVPDNAKTSTFTTLSTQPATSWANTISSLSKPTSNELLLPETTSLGREASGVSTLSASSHGSLSEQGRYVTRILLRQTVSLNRESSANKSWNPDKDLDSNITWPNLKEEDANSSRTPSSDQFPKADLNFV